MTKSCVDDGETRPTGNILVSKAMNDLKYNYMIYNKIFTVKVQYLDLID